MPFLNSFEFNSIIENIDRGGFSIFVIFSVCVTFCILVITSVFFKTPAIIVNANKSFVVVNDAFGVTEDVSEDILEDVLEDSDDVLEDSDDVNSIVESIVPVITFISNESTLEDKHKAAVRYLFECSTIFDWYESQITAEMFSVLERNFKHKEPEPIIKIIKIICSSWDKYRAIKSRSDISCLSRKHKNAKVWNSELNMLRKWMKPESELRNLMLLDSYHGRLRPFLHQTKI